jgi:hypothetical protein
VLLGADVGSSVRPTTVDKALPTLLIMSIITHIEAAVARLRRHHAAATYEWILRFESHIDPRAAATAGR